MIGILYQIGVKLFSIVFWIYSFANAKAAKRRKGLNHSTSFSGTNNVLFHCASAGEFEQIYPIIKSLRKELPATKIIVSFFSPSGVEWIDKKKIDIDCCYFPTDGQKAVNKFLQSINPRAVIIAKNEFWFNFLSACHKKSIPVFQVAVAFKENHFALRFDYFKQILQKSTKIWTLDEQSFDYALSHLNNIERGGDPRIDRIIEQAAKLKFPDKLLSYTMKPLIVYASVHREDLPFLQLSIKNENFHHILVPHDVHKSEIQYFEDKIESQTLKYSQLTDNFQNTKALLIDNIGMLSSLYSKASYAYIGGGFGKGIHNILESAIFGNIIFIGPRNEHFPEARILKKLNAIVEIAKTSDLDKCIALLNNDDQKEMKAKMSSFFVNHQGASEKITSAILNHLS